MSFRHTQCLEYMLLCVCVRGEGGVGGGGGGGGWEEVKT